MRKLAIIGTSNAVMKNGYGDLLKLRLTNDVDNFSIGAHSSLLAVYRIITEKIIDNYEYVLIDFSLNETHYINAKMHNFFYIISYLVFICNKFEKSKSILVFLILPSVCYSCDKSVSYIYRAFADIYRIPVIDIELSLKIFPSHNLGRKNDLVHFNDYIQSYIANEIIKFCIKKQNNIKCRNLSQEDINFFILDRSILENISKSTELMHTSLLSRNTYNVEENIIKIPTNLFLVGVIISGNELP